MSGFAVLYRASMDHPLFREDMARLGAWTWLIMRAAWKPTPYDIAGKIVTIERGQVCASRSQLAKAWGWSPSAVERFLTRLQTEQMIGRATGQGKSIITICNYAKYQDVSEQTGQATGQATGQPSDSHRTTKEQGNQLTSVSVAKATSTQASETDWIFADWNAMASTASLAQCQKISAKRRKAATARLRDDGLQAIQQALRKIPQSEFLRGETGDWNGADIDFFLRPDSITKIIEGKYDDRTNKRSETGDKRDGIAKALDRRIEQSSRTPERYDVGQIEDGSGYTVARLAALR